MNIIKSDIDFKYDYTGPEGISTYIFPDNFLCMLIGKPGSGKTTLLRQLLLSPDLLFKKFDYVFIMSPSLEEFPFIMNTDSMTKKFDIAWFYKVLSVIKSDIHVDILIVIDDYVSQIKKNITNPLLQQLFFNRRHLVKNGTISIIITSQRYMAIPAPVRSVVTMIIMFQLTRRDIEKVWEEHISLSKKEFVSLALFEKKSDFLVCNLQDNLFFLRFDQVTFSR